MTDRIDLDDLETDDETDADSKPRGDWLWRDEESAETNSDSSPPRRTETDRRSEGRDGADSAPEEPDESVDRDSSTDAERVPVPHVPNTEDPTPAGIPTRGADADDGAPRSTAAAAETESMRPMGGGTDAADDGATGPHGRGADEMTMAITYRALKRLAHPAAVFASAYEWSDWVGIVGDVPAHVVQKFQRDRGIDVDFFNGTGTGPAERLAEIDRNSMFYADRMVVVGLEGEDEPIAESADWEFVPLETAAKKADWELEDQS